MVGLSTSGQNGGCQFLFTSARSVFMMTILMMMMMMEEEENDDVAVDVYEEYDGE